MNKDLFGDTLIDGISEAKALVDSKNKVTLNIKHRPATKQGFELFTGRGVTKEFAPGFFDKVGLISFHKKGDEGEDLCLYVEQTKNSIGTRISRFIKEVEGNSRPSEGNGGGRNYRQTWGNDFDGLYVNIYSVSDYYNIDLDVLKDAMVETLKPMFNKRRNVNKAKKR